MSFELPDGSSVWLNDGSKLKYPASFSGKQREVHLEGEAFFNISKNEKIPFIVNSSTAAIRVTGTSFNVRAYPGDPVFEATLNSGIIELNIPRGTTDVQQIAMKPGEQVSVNLKTGQIDKKYVNAEEFNAWINGKLLFRDTPLDEVVLRLERWYNADIRLSSPELQNILITATFQEEKLTQALELLSYATPIKYSVSPRKRKEDGTYTKQLITISKR
jgi:ferric-dicitrate binding protein FerR (iron transport regulator)